ncbi:MAG: GLUG motif-containing protein, partial [Hominisplanchenecus sp.]
MKKWRTELKRLFVVLLTAALVGNTSDFSALTVSAETAGQTEESSAVIVSFGELSEEVREQLLPVGANESDIIFPDTLTVTVEKTAPEEETGTGEETVSGGDVEEGTDGQIITEDITLENITWELDADNSDSDTFLSDESANGYFYTYVPVLPETVTLTDSEGEVCDFTLTLDKNVYLPVSYVLVGDRGIATFSAAGHYNENGFCTGYELNESGNWVQNTCTDGSCNGYQPATLTTNKYNIDGVEGFDEVYEIGNAGQLYWYAGLVNGTLTGVTQDKSANAVLTDNITVNRNLLENLNADGTVKDGYEVRSWTSIGGYYNSNYVKYSGIFDGNNHTISGLYYYYESSSEETVFVGLVGIVEENGSVSNVGVVDSYFQLSGIFYSGFVGGVCGVNEAGSIKNCYIEKSLAVTNSTYYCQVGGVCGVNDAGSIKNCHNAGKVKATGCHTDTEIRIGVGGVCGTNQDGTITNCYNAGEVTATAGGRCYVGGVSGTNRDGTITNCYNTGNVTATGEAAYVGGVSGTNQDGTITNCYYLSETATEDGGETEAQFKSGSVCYLLNVGITNGSQVWYQLLDTETYPNLDSTNSASRTVYQCAPCTAVYSNTPGKTVAHIFEKADDTNHKCKVCGWETGHFTETLTYTADEDKNEITVKCGDDCGKEYGTVTLSAPTGDLTYDGTSKTVSVTNNVTGVTISNPTITYSKAGDAT